MNQGIDTNKIDFVINSNKSFNMSRNKLIHSNDYLIKRRKTYDNQIKIPYCTAVFS